MWTILRPLALACLLTPVAGCGTIVTFTLGPGTPEEPIRPGIYGGVRWDAWEYCNAEFWEIPCGGIFKCLCLWDVPLSLVADTLTLPFTALLELFRSREPAPVTSSRRGR